MLNFWQELPSKLNPVLVNLGGVEIRYYSLMYLVAFAIVYLLVKYRLKTENKFGEISLVTVQDFFMWTFLAVVLGGRLGYVLFYDLAYYVANPLQILIPYDFSTGEFTGIAGMSFHGGLIAVIVATYLFARQYKVSAQKLVDLIVPAVPLGYMFGRIGNFLNNELWGRSTDFVLGMQVFASEEVLRHPSQLYEAFFEGLVLFALLWLVRKKSWAEGKFLGFFLIGYGLARFFIEFVREPDAHLGLIGLGLSMGQILCLLMILAGVTQIMLAVRWRGWRK